MCLTTLLTLIIHFQSARRTARTKEDKSSGTQRLVHASCCTIRDACTKRCVPHHLPPFVPQLLATRSLAFAFVRYWAPLLAHCSSNQEVQNPSGAGGAPTPPAAAPETAPTPAPAAEAQAKSESVKATPAVRMGQSPSLGTPDGAKHEVAASGSPRLR